LNVADIVKKLGLSQPTISHHLAILKDAGVIKSKTKGTSSIYSICCETSSKCCLMLKKFFKN
jgi:ArsR family transcriptional regulator